MNHVNFVFPSVPLQQVLNNPNPTLPLYQRAMSQRITLLQDRTASIPRPSNLDAFLRALSDTQFVSATNNHNFGMPIMRPLTMMQPDQLPSAQTPVLLTAENEQLLRELDGFLRQCNLMRWAVPPGNNRNVVLPAMHMPPFLSTTEASAVSTLGNGNVPTNQTLNAAFSSVPPLAYASQARPDQRPEPPTPPQPQLQPLSSVASMQHKRFKCEQCDKSFMCKQSLRCHQRIHSADAFNCPHCQKLFGRRSNLVQHIRVHTNERPFKCSYCPKDFKQHSALKVHLRLHTGERPFKCNVCKKEFVTKCNLNTHQRQHTGEKPFGCLVCRKKYASQSGLDSHFKRRPQHKKSNRTPIDIL